MLRKNREIHLAIAKSFPDEVFGTHKRAAKNWIITRYKAHLSGGACVLDGRKPYRLSCSVSTQLIAEIPLASPVSFCLEWLATKCAIARGAVEYVARFTEHRWGPREST